MEWNTFVEVTPRNDKYSVSPVTVSSSPVSISEVSVLKKHAITTQIQEVDQVLGDGLVMGSVCLLGGEPGIGKSTLSLQICQKIAQKKSTVLYVTAEESESQIRLRAERLGVLPESLWVISETNIKTIIQHCETLKPDLVLLDSIQVVYNPELSGVEGTVTQVRHCANVFLNWIKKHQKAGILIGHITKEGQLAGPKVLEHLVDVILYLEGDRQQQYRILRCYKNRFYDTHHIGIFEMDKKGLKEIPHPSQRFLDSNCLHNPGSVIVPVAEGNRVFLSEIQALVVESGYGMAKRNFVGVNANRANLMIAACDKLFRCRLSAHDIFLTIIGGVKVSEPSIDLAMIVAILSSLKNCSIKKKIGVIGEVGLTGEIRPVPHIKQRLIELQKMGFTACVAPAQNQSEELTVKGIDIIWVSELKDVLRSLFAS